jgi:exopolysaccharide biosynthesis polyprenyl glycosylphosphotransferase
MGAALISIGASVTLGSLAARQLYREHVRRVLPVELSGLARASLVAAVAVGVSDDALDANIGLRVAAAGFALELALIVLERSAARVIVRAARRSGRYQQRVLLVGESSATAHLAEELRARPSEGYLVVGAVRDETSHRLWRVTCPYLGPVEQMEKALIDTGATGAIVAPDGLGRRDATQVVRRLVDAGVSVQLSGTLGLHYRRLRPTAIGHETAFFVERVVLTGPQRVVKRAIDLVGAAVCLVLASPVLLCAAIAIKAHDGGPVLFCQRRVGRHGDTFLMLKLRTMDIDAEDRRAALEPENLRTGPMFKHGDDPRATRPGRLLRAASIDELPQLWNVVRGEMSLVGPRPALPSEAAQFGADLNRRHAVRPGITGLWQVEARDSARFEDLERHDLFYVENWSVLLDLGLLVRTSSGVFSRTWRFLRHDESAW